MNTNMPDGYYWFAVEAAPGGAIIAYLYNGSWFLPGVAGPFDLEFSAMIGPVPPPVIPKAMIN